MNSAETLGFLKAPPGDRLEALAGDRKGQYSIRINDRWRLCFRYEKGNAYEVEIVAYLMKGETGHDATESCASR